MRRIVVTPLVAAFAVACVPQNVEITSGSYVAFLSDGSSLSLERGLVNPDKFDITYNIDCRDIDGDDDLDDDDLDSRQRLDDPLDVCGPFITPIDPDGDGPEVAEVLEPQLEGWIASSGFVVVSEELSPWRGEALITSEGDFQIGFHHRIKGGEDSRFVMAIDPNFQPTTCVEDGDAVVAEPLHGDWIENWSTEVDYLAGLSEAQFAPYEFANDYLVDGAQMYFLTAFSRQFNPLATEETWSIPDEWQAGAAQGKFSEELVFHRSSRYGEPFAYAAVESTDVLTTTIPVADLFYVAMGPEDDPAEFMPMVNQTERVRDVANGTRRELNKVFTESGADDPYFTYAPVAHNNTWRQPDGRAAGLDGWGELHYNWIVFSPDSELVVGGQASGAFSLLLDAADSASRVVVKGTFEISKIKSDSWVTDDLLETKLDESGVTLCQ